MTLEQEISTSLLVSRTLCCGPTLLRADSRPTSSASYRAPYQVLSSMSLYPQTQSQAYGAAAYPPQGYGQPPMYAQPAYNYAPPAQPVFHVDPTSFRREYSTRLVELTVNSRPIIQNLSMLAQDYSRFADTVVQCIESHIRRVSPCTLRKHLMHCSLPCSHPFIAGKPG